MTTTATATTRITAEKAVSNNYDNGNGKIHRRDAEGAEDNNGQDPTTTTATSTLADASGS
jgi:hypothetical protein